MTDPHIYSVLITELGAQKLNLRGAFEEGFELNSPDTASLEDAWNTSTAKEVYDQLTLRIDTLRGKL